MLANSLSRLLFSLVLLSGCCASSQPLPVIASPALTRVSNNATSAPPFPSVVGERRQRSGTGRAAPPAPSTGCRAEHSGQAGWGRVDAFGRETSFFVTLPPDYGAAQPQALVFAFPGESASAWFGSSGSPALFDKDLGTRAIVVYLTHETPSQVGAGVSSHFDALYSNVLSRYCVDGERVFAVGHGSGAAWVQSLACTQSNRLRAVATVSGNVEQDECWGRTAAMMIHGRQDAPVSISRARRALEQTLYQNHCALTGRPSSSGSCFHYAHCAEGLPVAWCEHDEPAGHGPNPGWPSFASAAISEFFDKVQPLALPQSSNLLAAPLSTSTWDAHFDSADLGHVEMQEGAVCAYLAQAGDNPWSVQLADHDLTLQAGQRYRLDVRLRASAPTRVRLKVGQQTPPYGEVWVQTRRVDTESIRVVDEFTLVEEPVEGAMAFALQAAGPLAETLPVRVCVQHAWLSPVSAGD